MEKRKTPALKTVEKALGILDIVGEAKKPMSASEIARIARTPISTTYKMLSTMAEMEYIEFDETTKFYQTGTKVLRFASNLNESRSINQVAFPIMLTVAEQTKETVHLGVPEEYHGVFLEKVNSPHTVGVQTRIGTRIPFNIGATSKAMMAFLPEGRFQDFCENFLDDGTETGKRAVAKAIEQRESIRQAGYAVTFEEVNPNVAAVAAPVFGFGNMLLGSMAIAGPCERFTEDAITRYIPLIKEACKTLSKKLGATV